jgi:hypothetical protein
MNGRANNLCKVRWSFDRRVVLGPSISVLAVFQIVEKKPGLNNVHKTPSLRARVIAHRKLRYITESSSVRKSIGQGDSLRVCGQAWSGKWTVVLIWGNGLPGDWERAWLKGRRKIGGGVFSDLGLTALPSIHETQWISSVFIHMSEYVIPGLTNLQLNDVRNAINIKIYIF